jgi:hypothetical protein
MGKKSSSSSQPSQVASPTLELPRMDAPPPYDEVARSSTSSSVRSVDRLDPAGVEQQARNASRDRAADSTTGAPAQAERRVREDGGCCESFSGCGWDGILELS